MRALNTAGRLAVLIITLAVFAGPATASEVLYTGKFKGAGGKKSSGNFDIYKEGGKTFIKLKNNFRLSSVPDPKLAFGNGSYKKGTIYTGKLKRLKGEQTYEIPSRLDPAKFSQVWIWCEKYHVPLAVASIKKK